VAIFCTCAWPKVALNVHQSEIFYILRTLSTTNSNLGSNCLTGGWQMLFLHMHSKNCQILDDCGIHLLSRSIGHQAWRTQFLGKMLKQKLESDCFCTGALRKDVIFSSCTWFEFCWPRSISCWRSTMTTDRGLIKLTSCETSPSIRQSFPNKGR